MTDFTMHTEMLRLHELLGPEDFKALQEAAKRSLAAPAGRLVPVPVPTYRKLEDAVEHTFQPQLEAVREAERAPAVEAVKLRFR